jgi:hypothetical protein
MAVEENVPSRSRTVTSIMVGFSPDCLITYVEWQICHLVARPFYVYLEENPGNQMWNH